MTRQDRRTGPEAGAGGEVRGDPLIEAGRRADRQAQSEVTRSMTDQEGARRMTPRILAFAGSTRRDSFNKRLVPIATKGARDAGAEVTLIDLKDFPLPLFDQDFEAEQGMPEDGARLKKLFTDHDGLLLASPEYNGPVTGVLKNAFDWVSRTAPGEPPLVAFRGKAA